MAKNRRSGNAGDTAAAYSDTAELLNKETARLLADSMRSEGAPPFKAVDSGAVGRGRSADPIPEKSGELTSDKPEVKTESKKRARKPKTVSGAAAEPAEDKGADKPEAESKKRTRKPKTVAEALAAELIEDKPEVSLESGKRSRKTKPVGDEAAEFAEDKTVDKSEAKTESKKRVRKAKAAAEEAMAEKDSENDDESGRGGCKTPQVLKLLDGDGDNLVLFAGKSRVPNLLRGRESLSRMARKNGIPDSDDTEVVNITELVIRHEAADILDRFNACSCEKCVKVFSEMISQRIPVRYARISRAELESGELPERAASMRQVVLPEMIRQLICNKKRCFHDE